MRATFVCAFLALFVITAAIKDNPVEKEIRKLAEEAISKVIDIAMPKSIMIPGKHNISRKFQEKWIGEVDLNLVLDKTNVTGLKSANTNFSDFTETGVNVTINFPNAIIDSEGTGQICSLGHCENKIDKLTMTAPLVVVAAVTYKIKWLGPIPIGLQGDPCLGPVLQSSLGKVSVTGFGFANKYVTEAMNAVISEQRLFEKPIDEAFNAALKLAEKNCNFSEASVVIV